MVESAFNMRPSSEMRRASVGEATSAAAAAAASRKKRIVVGICAMHKKTSSKPMREILDRLPKDIFHICIFQEKILEEPVEKWPLCDSLIAFHSHGYPLNKALDYVALRKPFLVNDIARQHLLRDRRSVYEVLTRAGVPTPRYAAINRDGSAPDPEEALEEFDDYIVVKGVRIEKPFVEKPADADDHKIHIYYPSFAGGGCKQLFRKVDNKSSAYLPDCNTVRRDKSYLYEEFVDTQGTDVKVYAVGPYYGHAEARKSPALDGIVMRGDDGKELRYPVILSWIEKDIAFKIYHAFKQTVCGFDILRTHDNRTLVCDVNGWSFVKKSRKYYDDCAYKLAELMELRRPLVGPFDDLVPTREIKLPSASLTEDLLRSTAPLQPLPLHSAVYQKSLSMPVMANNNNSNNNNNTEHASTAWPKDDPFEEPPSSAMNDKSPTGGHRGSGSSSTRGAPPAFSSASSNASSSGGLSSGTSPAPDDKPRDGRELRCVIAVIRHGDRTPKRKLKLKTTSPRLLAIHSKHAKSGRHEAKIRESKDLRVFIEALRETRDEARTKDAAMAKQITRYLDVLESHVPRQSSLAPSGVSTLSTALFSGIKVQLKPTAWEDPAPAPAPALAPAPAPAAEATNPETADGEKTTPADGGGGGAEDEDDDATKEAPLVAAADEEVARSAAVTEVQLILKWGGVLTELGVEHAAALGAHFRRSMYPSSEDGQGLLRLHATFRHDLKIRTSDEGRVMKTGAAFTKGLLELEGDISPILVSLIHRGRSDVNMLDRAGNHEAQDLLKDAKAHVEATFQMDLDLNAPDDDEPNLGRLIAPDGPDSVIASLRKVGNPRKALERLYDLVDAFVTAIEKRQYLGDDEADKKEYNDAVAASSSSSPKTKNGDDDDPLACADAADPPVKKEKPPFLLYMGEPFKVWLDSWYDMRRELRKKVKKGKKGGAAPKSDQAFHYDLSKVPECFDKVRFDAQHNYDRLDLGAVFPAFATELIPLSQTLSSAVTPLEFGGAADERRGAAWRISHALLDKIRQDLLMGRGGSGDPSHGLHFQLDDDPMHLSENEVKSSWRAVRTRLYFTSESHLHALLTALRLPWPQAVDDTAVSESSKVSDDTAASATALSAIAETVPSFLQPRPPSPPGHATTTSGFGGGAGDPTAPTDPTADVGDLASWRRRTSMSFDENPQSSVVGADGQKWLSGINELSYLSHVVFRVWEDFDVDPAAPERHMVELSFSPGTPFRRTAHTNGPTNGPTTTTHAAAEETTDDDDDDDTDAEDEAAPPPKRTSPDVPGLPCAPNDLPPTDPRHEFAYVPSTFLEEYFDVKLPRASGAAESTTNTKYADLAKRLDDAADRQRKKRASSSTPAPSS